MRTDTDTKRDDGIRLGGFPPEFDGRRRVGVKCVADAVGCGFHVEARVSTTTLGPTLTDEWAACDACPDCGGDVLMFDYPGYTTMDPN